MKTKSKLPIVLKALSVALIVSPIGNFFWSAYMAGAEPYDLAKIGELLTRIPFVDWVWNLLLVISGVLILLRRKLSWLVAIASIFLCTAINLYKYFVLPEAFGLSYQLFAISTSIGAILIVAYFKYPYLDRRDRWFSFHKRHATSLPAKLKGHSTTITVKDLSLSGAQLETPNPELFEPDQVYPIEIAGYPFDVRVVWMNGRQIGVEFENLSRELKGRVADWIKQS